MTQSKGLPTISVIIPSFNSGRFIAKTLATIVKQDYRQTELIVVDGGSRDDTAMVLKAYQRFLTHSVSESDEGQLDALQKGIRRATGEVLYWLNADDVVMPGTFNYVGRLFSENRHIDMVFGDDYAFDEERRKVYVGSTIRGMTFWDHFLFYRQMYSECVFWRREISDQAIPVDASFRACTDYSFFLPLRFDRACRWVPRRLGAFRVAADQMSQRHRERVAVEREQVKKRMRSRLGMSEVEFARRRRRHWLSFALRQRVYPKLNAGFRFVGRKLTGDVRRRRLEQWFFDEWLWPPVDVLGALPPHTYTKGSD